VEESQGIRAEVETTMVFDKLIEIGAKYSWARHAAGQVRAIASPKPQRYRKNEPNVAPALRGG